MEIFIALKNRFGIEDYIGCYSDEYKAAKAESGCKVLVKSIETEKLIDNEIFIASSYSPGLDLHSFIDIFYSLDEAIKAAGEKGLVYNHSVDIIFKAA